MCAGATAIGGGAVVDVISADSVAVTPVTDEADRSVAIRKVARAFSPP